MNAIWIVICAIFCAFGGYTIGLRRGIKVSDGLYDMGFEAGITYCKQHYEMTEIEPMLDDLYEEQKYKKVKQLVKELDELFDPECPLPEDEDNVIDGGYYD